MSAANLRLERLYHLTGNPIFQAARRKAHYVLRTPLPNLAHIQDFPGYILRQYITPNPIASTLAPLAPHETRVTVPVGSYLVGFSGSATAKDQLEIQVVDLREGSTLFNRPQFMNNLVPSGRGPAYMAAPKVIVEPGVISVVFRNLSNATNTVELILWILEPETN